MFILNFKRQLKSKTIQLIEEIYLHQNKVKVPHLWENEGNLKKYLKWWLIFFCWHKTEFQEKKSGFKV